ncbi:MAG: hydroxymethylbilane synthase, partial [Methylocella sp.]
MALAQTRELKDRLIAAHGLDAAAIEIAAMKTSGDTIINLPLSEAGGKGLFTKELDLALAERNIEMAVHSAKDLPTFLPEGIEIAGYLPRADVRDAWISPHAPHPLKLPPGSVVGTASLRRGAMVRRLRPDLKIALLRGNVETRLAKVARGEFAATLLALAGLKRLGLEAAATA